MPDPLLAYISQGQLHLQCDGGGEILESPFGLSLRDRAIQIQNRNAWKFRGQGGKCLTRALHMAPEADLSAFRIAITSVTRGLRPGELLYTLETDEISGVFARDGAGIEKRLFHTADFRACQADAHPHGSEIALSVAHPAGIVNLAVLKTDGSDLTEVTDGESVDQAPRWIPGPGRRLVFQSAGMARDSKARLAGQGPFAVHRLDLDSGEMSCLAQDSAFHYLGPRIAADGTLYYIRRPVQEATPAVAPWASLAGLALLPLGILWLTAMAANLFTERRTGRPLFTVKHPAEKVLETPSFWLLMRQKPGRGVETIADRVLSFDLAADGSVVYSNGVDVYRIASDGGPAAKVMSGAGIDFIAVM